MEKKVKCSVCGKELVEKCMRYNIDLRQGYSMSGDLEKSAGRYAGRKYHICYECWLSCMGVLDS